MEFGLAIPLLGLCNGSEPSLMVRSSLGRAGQGFLVAVVDATQLSFKIEFLNFAHIDSTMADSLLLLVENATKFVRDRSSGVLVEVSSARLFFVHRIDHVRLRFAVAPRLLYINDVTSLALIVSVVDLKFADLIVVAPVLGVKGS